MCTTIGSGCSGWGATAAERFTIRQHVLTQALRPSAWHHLAMRYWWVNQNATYRHELAGGYMWSPKRKRDGNRNAFYDFMREVAPGDIIFSFCDSQIQAIGIAASHCYEAPKPLEFGSVGAYWENIGWRVDVTYIRLKALLKPSSFMDRLAPHLPSKYSPLRPNGHGLQSVYLASVPTSLAGALVDLIGPEARDIVRGATQLEAPTNSAAIGLDEWEEYEANRVRQNTEISDTERHALILARRGQGKFRRMVEQIERRCRLTGVDRPEHLRASHCKPWRDASNEERLDGQNGLLLTPNADHLFDRGFISFERNGRLLISPVAHRPSLQRLGIDAGTPRSVGSFTAAQAQYLDYHREFVFLESSFLHD